MKIYLPDEINFIIDTIENAGYEAFAVGGCVRDALLGIKPYDYDITTSATPDEIKKLFPKTADTGIAHGTVTVITENYATEVTTFRTDGQYLNARKPENVKFVADIYEDLKRRDFTVNALAYNKKSGITDAFGGQIDLKNKILRTVGVPDKRFSEDALRILRLFRFSSKFNFKIEPETYKSALKNSPLLSNISRERIFSELINTIMAEHPEKIIPFISSGGLKSIGIENYTEKYPLNILPSIRELRFFAFAENCNTDAEVLAKNLKSDNRLKDVCKKLSALTSIDENDKVKLKRAMRTYTPQIVEYRLILDGKSREKFDEIQNNNEPYLISQLDIDGFDIENSGVSKDNIGNVLLCLSDYVIEHPSENHKNILLSKIKN